MQFSGHATSLDLCSATDYACKTNTTTYPLVDKARNANMALDRIVSMIMRADGRWKWDDSNYTDLPIGVADLVASQRDYGFDTTHLKVLWVSIKDSSGNWVKLPHTALSELYQDIAEYQETSGTPSEYTKVAASIYLSPAPSYGSTGGLKVGFQRGSSHFTSTDTTKEPGFAVQFHPLVYMIMAETYFIANPSNINNSKLVSIQKEIAKQEDEIIKFYSIRDEEDHRVRLEFREEDYGGGGSRNFYRGDKQAL